MHFEVKTELVGLDHALASLLPKDISIQGLRLLDEELVLSLTLPFIGASELRAQRSPIEKGMLLSNFELKGGFGSSIALGKIKRKISELDIVLSPFHLWGEVDGERLHITWG